MLPKNHPTLQVFPVLERWSKYAKFWWFISLSIL